MKGAEFLVRALDREGVDYIFGYPGGAIMPVYDALLDCKARHILVRNEQGAALMADGYARATGRVGVCMATSGPGATNLVTGIANSFLDSVPVVAITGQVPTPLMGTDAFQEVDVFGITLPIVKHSFIVKKAADLPWVVPEAFRIAASGRPGPVLIDLPKDVANTEQDFQFGRASGVYEAPVPDPELLRQAAQLIRESSRPVLYAGGGIGMAHAVDEYRHFAKTTRIPAISTLKGLGALPTDDPQFLGMMGMHGFKASNLAVQGCDLLICIGARFDDRATGKLNEFAPNAKVIHLDADPSEIGKLRRATVGIAGDLRRALTFLAVPPTHDIEPWRRECFENRTKNAWDYDAPSRNIYAPRFLKKLSEAVESETIFCCDVGQHQMWVAQHCRFRRPEHHLTSGGLGTMGYGLPAAIGAQFGRPEARVICVSGDGSIMMNVQEMATVRRYDLPVKIVLLDNSALGMVRQWQELFFNNRYSEVDLSDNPDFVRVAEAFGIPGFRVERANQEDEAVERIMDHKQGPLMVHVKIDQAANVWPLVPPGASNSKMMEGAHR